MVNINNRDERKDTSTSEKAGKPLETKLCCWNLIKKHLVIHLCMLLCTILKVDKGGTHKIDGMTRTLITRQNPRNQIERIEEAKKEERKLIIIENCFDTTIRIFKRWAEERNGKWIPVVSKGSVNLMKNCKIMYWKKIGRKFSQNCGACTLGEMGIARRKTQEINETFFLIVALT